MPRYFLEVAYKGTRYSGFQIQENAPTIQAEIQKAFAILQRKPVMLTGSSRTDAGVHALQNYFHFDFEEEINDQFIYKINAILPDDIVVKALYKMNESAHSRFEARSREYEYRLYAAKNPFLKGLAFYYPYTVDLEMMDKAAVIIIKNSNFKSFCKSNSQVSNYNCTIIKSHWFQREGQLVFNIEGNRFLRGMVRMLTATMLQVGRGRLSLEDFESFFSANSVPTTYSIGAGGLYLKSVQFPAAYLPEK